MGANKLRPSKKSRYAQGYIDPRTCHKLINGDTPVVYRSSYERKFIIWCETCQSVVRWGSECVCIPYLWPDGTRHKYYPDYYVEFKDGTKVIVEVKPANQTKPPVNENAWQNKEWVKNCCKWKAAQEYCTAKGFEFKIITEHTIKQLL